MILYLAADLIWATKIREAAAAAGVEVRPARSVEMLRARLADSPVRGMVADLEAGPAALDLIRALKAEGAGVPVVAWGPHVETARLDQARQAGADSVMVRGAFANRLGEVLRRLDSGAGVPDDRHE